jgi:hypothetical protein
MCEWWVSANEVKPLCRHIMLALKVLSSPLVSSRLLSQPLSCNLLLPDSRYNICNSLGPTLCCVHTQTDCQTALPHCEGWVMSDKYRVRCFPERGLKCVQQNRASICCLNVEAARAGDTVTRKWIGRSGFDIRQCSIPPPPRKVPNPLLLDVHCGSSPARGAVCHSPPPGVIASKILFRVQRNA